MFFRKMLAWYEGFGPEPRSFLIYQPTAIDQKTMMNLWFFKFLKLLTETIQNRKHLKINKSRYFVTLSKL